MHINQFLPKKEWEKEHHKNVSTEKSNILDLVKEGEGEGTTAAQKIVQVNV